MPTFGLSGAKPKPLSPGTEGSNPALERCPLETSKLPNSAGDRRFESISLQQRVCKLSVPLALSGSRHAVATWRCSSPTPRYRGRLPVVTDIARLPQAPLLRHPYRRRLSRSRLHLNPGPILAVRFCPLHSRTPAIVTAAWWTRASVRRTAPSRRSGPRMNIRSRRTRPRSYRKCGMTSWANSVIDCFTSAWSISPPWLK